jgi:hypothetical protein
MNKKPLYYWLVDEIVIDVLASLPVVAVIHYLYGNVLYTFLAFAAFVLLMQQRLRYFDYIQHSPGRRLLCTLPIVKCEGVVIEKCIYFNWKQRWFPEWVLLSTEDGQQMKVYFPMSKIVSREEVLAINVGDTGMFHYYKGKKVNYLAGFEQGLRKEDYNEFREVKETEVKIDNDSEKSATHDSLITAMPSLTQSAKTNLSPEAIRGIIDVIVKSTRYRNFVIIFTLFAVTSFTTNLQHTLDSISNNQLFTNLISLTLWSATSIAVSIGFLKLRTALCVQPQTSPSLGLNIIKFAALFTMVALPAVILVTVFIIEPDSFAGIISLSSNPIITTAVTIIAVLMVIVISSPIIIYSVFAVRTVNFLIKSYESKNVFFPKKTISALGITSRIAGVIFFFIAFWSITGIDITITNIIGLLSVFLSAIAYFMMGSILLEFKKYICTLSMRRKGGSGNA